MPHGTKKSEMKKKMTEHKVKGRVSGEPLKRTYHDTNALDKGRKEPTVYIAVSSPLPLLKNIDLNAIIMENSRSNTSEIFRITGAWKAQSKKS